MEGAKGVERKQQRPNGKIKVSLTHRSYHMHVSKGQLLLTCDAKIAPYLLTTLPITGLYPLFYIEYDCCNLGDTKHDTKKDIGASGIDYNQVKGPNDLVGTRESI